jgi:23S rRNA (uracil1939-C5)-methyltransferase
MVQCPAHTLGKDLYTVPQTIDLTLHDLAHGGEAVGRHEGLAVFVPYGIPGESVRVEVVARRKRFARGRIVEILEPSPSRVSPPCPYFGVCGGCQTQHMDYAAQAAHKRQVVATQLERIGRQADARVLETLGMAEPWAYRNHIQAGVDGRGRLGFQAAGTGPGGVERIVPIAGCLITDPGIEETWHGRATTVAARHHASLERVVLRAGTATGERMVILEGHGRRPPRVPRESEASWLYRGRDGLRVLAGHDYLVDELAGRRLRVSADAFFQVNTRQAERLVEVAGRYLALTGQETLLDAYSGVGAFALTLGQRAARVIGIESSPTAVSDAVANRQGGEPVEFLLGPVEAILPTVQTPIDAILLDPPRAGCSPAAVEALAERGAERIVYVSCDPATLARDVALFADRGYRLVEAQPVDLFPQTYHVETVCLMSTVDK